MARRGSNYFYLREFYNGVLPKPTVEYPRVFISHQKNDSEVASKIADYLVEAGVDIYFDQYDTTIDRSNPQSVVQAISYGINNCTHMLVVFSPNTLDSMWVPWEIGYAYTFPVTIGVLRIKGVPKSELPDYLKVVKVVSDIWDLNQFISNLTNTDGIHLLNEGRIKSYSDIYHPLSKYMDSI